MKTNKMIRSAGILLLTFCLPFMFWAQTEDRLPVEDLEVIKEFKARIGETQALLYKPDLPEFDTGRSAKYNYSLGEFNLPVPYTPPQLRPLAIPGKETPPLYKFYLKAMFGYPLSAYAQLNYVHSFDNGLDLGVDLNHESLNNHARNSYQRYGLNDIRISGAKQMENGMNVKLNLDYSYDKFLLYGHPDSLDQMFSEESLERKYQSLGALASLSNNTMNHMGLTYRASMGFNRLVNNLAGRQHDVGIKLGAAKWFDEKHPLDLELGADFSRYKDTVELDLDNFYFRPTFTYHLERFSLKAGINIASSRDRFYFYPETELKFKLADPGLMLFAGTEGRLEKLSYRTMLETNPYLNHRLDSIANLRRFSYYLGVKGVAGKIQYQLEGRYSKLKNLGVYLPLSADLAQNPGIFKTEFIDTASRITLNAGIKSSLTERINLDIQLYKYFYSFENESDEAWGLPRFEIAPRLSYRSNNKNLCLFTSVNIKSRIYHFRDQGEIVKGNLRTDLSLGGEYYFHKYFGLSAQLNNLLGNKYERWYQYPSVGILAQIGLVARF